MTTVLEPDDEVAEDVSIENVEEVTPFNTLEEVLHSIKAPDQSEETYPTFMSALNAYNTANVFFPFTGKRLHEIKERILSKRKKSSQNASKASVSRKSYYCSLFDKHMKMQNKAQTPKDTDKKKKRWSRPRDGIRFIMSIYECRDLLKNAFESNTREAIDDKQSSSKFETFFNGVVKTFNDSDFCPVTFPTSSPTDNDIDAVNIRLCQEYVDSSSKRQCVDLTFKMAVNHYTEFDKTFLTISTNMAKSGSHEPDPRKYCSTDEDLAYFYMRHALPTEYVTVGQGLLPVCLDTNVGPAKERTRKRRSREDDVLLKFLQESQAERRELTKSLLALASSSSEPAAKKSKREIIGDLIRVRKELTGMEEDDPMRTIFEAERDRLCALYKASS